MFTAANIFQNVRLLNDVKMIVHVNNILRTQTILKPVNKKTSLLRKSRFSKSILQKQIFKKQNIEKTNITKLNILFLKISNKTQIKT